MLAYDGGIPIAYGVGGTSFSIAVAIAASWVAFSVGLAGTSRHAPAVGGLLLGLGIAAMHVSGMRAIEVQGRVAFDPETSFAAVLLGTLIAGLALHSFQVLRGVRGLAASILLLVAAICVLHFQTGAAQPEAARLLADRILKLFSEEMDTRRDPMAVGVSIGVAICPGDGTTAERLYGNADTALYRAKQTGKGIACFFDAEMDAAVRTRRQIENDLRHAVVRRQLFLEYQPLVDVRDDRIVGYEALLRWRHPDRGLVGPNLFIPIEESGSIIQIGEWVLEEACSEAVRWHEPLPVWVNVSPVQFLLPNLFDRIESILMRTGLEPRRLELEITEAALMHNRDDVLATLVRLRLLGVRIVMDDFGTGHSSLSNLQTFPFDKLKIDCSFTASLDKDPAAHAIIRAIIALGHSLNLPVVTEGVETERQRQIIVDEGCRQIQGFLTGRPGLAPSVDAASSSSTMPHRVGA
ncbi:EAL domain-containing protein [Sinorhizobium meliloti]|nr:EAL domain-containing protein [Sinorhizobium meliloti]MDW9761454.1 EAL domain-containing protein [Sinorhizobium meliloti]MDX0299170.1 EAL domain-containing protein [Sinorhizobium meliloti]